MFRKIILNTSQIFRNNHCRSICVFSKKLGIYEPDYLDALKSKYPQYECLNFQIRGYDYAILESYQKYLHSVADYLDLDVSDSFAVPPRKALVQKFKPVSSVIETEYTLTTFERNIQIWNLDVPSYPLFLRIAQAALPEGVTMNVFESNDDLEENRYIPDKDLIDLKSQLEIMQSGREAKKK